MGTRQQGSASRVEIDQTIKCSARLEGEKTQYMSPKISKQVSMEKKQTTFTQEDPLVKIVLRVLTREKLGHYAK